VARRRKTVRGSEPLRASPEEREVLERLRKLADGGELSFYSHVDDEPIPMPESLRVVASSAIIELAEGGAVQIAGLRQELTPRQAAELLGVSRPYVVRLLKEGAIPSHRVGSHHRVYLEDVLAYRRERDAARREGLDELSRRSQELGLG
jgi:excisionase family DNA binding protein